MSAKLSPPDWDLKSWRIVKRAELKDLVKQFNYFMFGCDYLPIDHDEIMDMQETLDRWTEDLSAEYWGH